MGKSLTLNKRKLYMEELRKKRIPTATLEDVEKLYKVTDLKSFKNKKKSENEGEPDKTEEDKQANENLQAVNQYLNDDDEDDSDYEVVDNKEIRELEGDMDEENEEDEPSEAEEQKDEADQEESKSQEEQDDQEGDDEEDKEEESLQPEKYDPQQRAEERRKLKLRILQRKQASKFLEEEAELGSDHEDNDGMLKTINKNDCEEILDRKLEFLDADLEDLIDNSLIKDSVDNLASKFLQDDILKDKQDLVKLITSITSGNRRGKVNTVGLENESDNVIWQRMRQRQNEFDNKEQELFGNEDVKQRILKA